MQKSFSELGIGNTDHESGFRTSVYDSQIQIQDYQSNIRRHYGAEADSLNGHSTFRHFGLKIAFHNPTEIGLMSDGKKLLPEVKQLLQQFGALTLINAILPETDRQNSQSNIFPNLKFHYDRTVSQENYFSMFYRDPFREDHQPPRTSSTLIMSNQVVELEARREEQWNGSLQPWYDLFQESDPGQMIGKTLLEQRWDAPAGTGELTIVDNSAVMHASYYRQSKGYPIAVRYLY